MAFLPKKSLNNEQRTAMMVELSQTCKQNGKPHKGAMLGTSASFGVSRSTIWRMWTKAKRQMMENHAINLRMEDRPGRPKVMIDLEVMAKIDLRKRSSIRRLGKELKIPKLTVGRRFQEGAIRRHTSSLRPLLTDGNKIVRMKFCLSMLDNTSLNNNPMIIDMYNYIHVDEKWFHLTKESQKYYLTPEEMEPERTCKSKSFITKVMFLTTVARPRSDPTSGEVFDGKIGTWAFVYDAPAQRNSKNTVARTIETKVIQAITQNVYRAYLIEKLLPAIKEKWPRRASCSTIFIQQDNARPHIIVTDLEFEAAARREGLDVKLLFQPPNSPDLNVLDLGYFRSIESLAQVEYMSNIDELVASILKSFDELLSDSLSKVFLSLQLCMVEVMKAKGSNNLKLPHVNKDHMLAVGILPRQVAVAPEVVEAAMAFLVEAEQSI